MTHAIPGLRLMSRHPGILAQDNVPDCDQSVDAGFQITQLHLTKPGHPPRFFMKWQARSGGSVLHSVVSEILLQARDCVVYRSIHTSGYQHAHVRSHCKSTARLDFGLRPCLR